MKKEKFSLFDISNFHTIANIDNCIKIALGPTGKNGILSTAKGDLKFLTSGSLFIKSLEFEYKSENTLLKILEQASIKTHKISGDGSTTTTLISCQLLKNSLELLNNGYNGIFLSNGLKKIAYFLTEKVLEYSVPISSVEQILGILKTSLGKKLNSELINLLSQVVSKIGRDGVVLVEENISPFSEIEIVQGIELDSGFASSYFVNDLKNFEVSFENPSLLICSSPLNSVNQIREIIDYIKANNKSLVIIAEQINSDVLSTLILNNIQKKLKVAVIKYVSIKFVKTGILEDLALLTHSRYFTSNLKPKNEQFSIEDLGQIEKIILKKNKSTFLLSKFSKVLAKRRINELNRELLTSETDYEKNLFKNRIARLSGNIAKIKIGTSNKYQIEEERQKIENAINTIHSSLEEGILPGGGIFYLHLCNELKNWGYLNLIGDEIFAMQLTCESLRRPFEELFNNTNTKSYQINQELLKKGYPYGYNLIEQKIVNTFDNGLLDSAKSIRAILWNSLTIISTLITSE